jgi:hypothetical protein
MLPLWGGELSISMPEIASGIFAFQRPVCFGTAKVRTFFAPANFIFLFFGRAF